MIEFGTTKLAQLIRFLTQLGSFFISGKQQISNCILLMMMFPGRFMGHCIGRSLSLAGLSAMWTHLFLHLMERLGLVVCFEIHKDVSWQHGVLVWQEILEFGKLKLLTSVKLLVGLKGCSFLVLL